MNQNAESGLFDSLARTMGDFLFTPSCMWCERSISPDEVDFCERCTGYFLPAEQPQCERCSAIVGPYLDTKNGCFTCQKERFHFNTITSLGAYDRELRKACLRCKIQGNNALTTALTNLLQQRNHDRLRNLEPDLIVPIPHHWSDRLLRPHQPPDAMAESIGAFLDVPIDRYLIRKTRRTAKQLTLTESERRKNLRSAFQCRSSDLTGATILLIDDVLTTGTTANQAARCLKQAKAKRIDVAVIARASHAP